MAASVIGTFDYIWGSGWTLGLETPRHDMQMEEAETLRPRL